MRLLYLCSDYGIPFGGTKGASIHLRAVTRALSEAGHEVRILSPKAEVPVEQSAEHPAKPLLPGGCPTADKTSKRLKHWLVDRGLCDGVARELRPLLYNAWVVDRALAAIENDPPDAILERLSLFGHTGLDLARAWNVPLIVEMNAPLVEEASAYRSLQLRALADEIEDRVIQKADAIVSVSSPLADWLASRGVAPSKVHVVPNGVDLRLFDSLGSRRACREGIGLGDDFVVGFAGSLKIWHGVDVLIDAVAKLRQAGVSARLLVVGTGPAETSLRERAAGAGLNGSAIFTGAVPHDRVPTLLRAMDVAVAPFRSADGFYFSPIKLFEYMAAGTCVIASDLGQISEVIQTGVNGLLCRPDDADALAESLMAAHRSAALRDRLAARARADVAERFTWSHAAETIVDVIRRARRTRLCASRKQEEAGPSATAAPGRAATGVSS